MSESQSTKSSKSIAIQFIIQVERPGKKLGMSDIQSLLEGTGIQLDSNYGPIPVNPKLGRYVVRGKATPEAKAKAERIPGVRFFADAKIKPTSK
jgi:hypothetical protein